MNIIKDGNKEIAERKRKQTKCFECRMCGCVFEADKGEYTDTGCQWDYYYYAKCPCCGDDADEKKEPLGL